MTATELICTLEQQGFTLFPLPEGKLAVKPAERLTEALREELKARKTELLALLTRPYLTAQGELRIPFTADEKYFWWQGGQSIAETLVELNAPDEVIRRYCGSYTKTKQ